MNFTPFETIEEVIQNGCTFWSVYDNTGKRLIFENNTPLAADESAALLKRVLSREQGEFAQIKLSARSSSERGAGGSTKTFGPYYYRLPNQSPAAYPVGMGAPNQSGVTLADYVSQINAVHNEKMERLKLELSQKEPGIIEKLATPENVDKLLTLGGDLVKAFKFKSAPQLGLPASANDAELNAALVELLTYEQAREALINIAKAGPMVWAMIRTGLKDNNLIQ